MRLCELGLGSLCPSSLAVDPVPVGAWEAWLQHNVMLTRHGRVIIMCFIT